MAITTKTVSALETPRLTTIDHFDDTGTTAASYKVGYKPRYVRVDNVTDRIMLEWYEGMATGTGIKTLAAGTRSLESSGAVAVSGDTIGFPVATNKQYRVQVIG